MHGWARALAAWAALCVAAAAAAQSSQSSSAQRPLTMPPDSGAACSCSGLLLRALDCSGRGRSKFGPSDMCNGRTTKVDLSNNRFSMMPMHWDKHTVDVNVSRNQLTALPSAPPLSVKTHTLDVSFNRIADARQELRPLAALQTLAVSGNSLQALSFLPAPCELRSLRADRNQLRTLQGPLNGCGKLEHLDLSDNPLRSLPRGVLAGLRSLQRLELARAGLSGVEAGALDGLHRLEYLSLSTNELTTLPSRLCAQLQQLEQLHLDNNKISSLPADVFSGMKEVEIIVLAKNKLSNLPQGLFSGLEKLKYVLLNENQLRFIPRGIFNGLQKLEGIGLPSNQLESLPALVFSGLRSLTSIGLSGNKLTTLPAGLLTDITSLELLDLGSNQFTSVPGGLLLGVKSIKTLDLSFNRLSTLSGRDLDGPKDIARLDLRGNLLTAVPEYDSSWPQVKTAFLDGNSVATASEAALRGWLGDGARDRLLGLGAHPPLRALHALRWALGERKVAASVDASNCACGALQRGRARVTFCAAVSCPGAAAADWKEAVRALDA